MIGAAAARESVLLAERSLRHIPRVPEKLADATVQPVIFVLVFAYVFGSVVRLPGGVDYHDYLISGMLGQAGSFALIGLAVGVASDVHSEIVERLRALPISRVALLAGRNIAQIVEGVLGTVVLVVLGLIIGWRPHSDVPHLFELAGLTVVWGFAMAWAGIFVGLLVRDPEAANTITFSAIFPLMFLSGVFVPVGGLPAPLDQIAAWNPLTPPIVAARELLGNAAPPLPDIWPLQHPILAVLGWSLLVTAVFAPLAVRRYRRMGT